MLKSSSPAAPTELPLHLPPPFVHFPSEEDASPGVNWCQSASEYQQQLVKYAAQQTLLDPSGWLEAQKRMRRTRTSEATH